MSDHCHNIKRDAIAEIERFYLELGWLTVASAAIATFAGLV